MTITRYIYSDKKYKQRLLDIQQKYSENNYYKDNPQKFSQLIMLREDYPNDYIQKIKNSYRYFDIKDWIQTLFSFNREIAVQLTLENEIQFIINNIIKLPFCKCKVKLKILENQH